MQGNVDRKLLPFTVLASKFDNGGTQGSANKEIWGGGIFPRRCVDFS